MICCKNVVDVTSLLLYYDCIENVTIHEVLIWPWNQPCDRLIALIGMYNTFMVVANLAIAERIT